MFMSLISHLLSAWFAFLLPCYGTWKALSHRPISEPEIERWGMYWAVIGVFVAFEYVAEWLISWFPFYWETKTILLLFLALPQTQGSTWVFQTYLQPFFVQNEAEIDASIAQAQANLLEFIQSHFAKLWDTVLGLATKTQQVAPGQEPSTPGQPAQTPTANPFGLAKGLWDSYGPSVIGVLQRQTQSRPSAASSSASVRTPGQEAQPPQHRQSPQPDHTASSPGFPEPQLY